MAPKNQIKPITYLKNQTAELVKEVSESGRSVIITQNGEAKVVVMDLHSYQRWRDAMALLKLLALGQAEVEADDVVSQEDAFARAARAIDRASEP